jgi:tol-pal system protein YbgF
MKAIGGLFLADSKSVALALNVRALQFSGGFMNFRTRLSLLISLPLLLNACAGQPIRTAETPQKNTELVWKADIEQRLDSISAAMPADMNEEFARLQAKMSVLEAENHREYLDTNNQIDSLSIRIAALNKEVKILQSKLQKLQSKAEEQPRKQQQAEKVEPPKKAEIKPEPITAAEKQRQNERAKKAYYASYFALKNGDYFEASLGFRNFIRDFPDSKLTGEANYWYGEALLAQGDTAMAIQVFQKIIKNKATAARHAAAMLKTGFIYEEQQKMDEAISIYNGLIRQHPASSEAETARSRLQRKSGHN